jgi:hypothetical protein
VTEPASGKWGCLGWGLVAFGLFYIGFERAAGSTAPYRGYAPAALLLLGAVILIALKLFTWRRD